jgi:glucokinase
MVGLIGDIGGTNARFALVEPDGSIHDVLPLVCRDYPSLSHACWGYLERVAPKAHPRRAALAVASPVFGDQITLTNLHWTFSIEETRRGLGFDVLEVINDFVAVALAIPRLAAGEVLKIGGGEAVRRAPMWALGPGTGLGASALVWTGDDWLALSSEGGHITIAAASDREAEVLAVLRRRLNHVSAERVVSGPGLLNLHAAIATLAGERPDPAIAPADITRRGLERSCPLSVETLEIFASMLGTVSSDLALMLNARGGLYIAGGIVPRLMPWFATSGFRRRFEEKGRFSAYLAEIPTFMITRRLPALVGLAGLVIKD